MLKSLYQYALDRKLSYPDGCIPKTPSAFLRLTEDGQYVGLEPNSDKQQLLIPTISYGSASKEFPEPFMEKLENLAKPNSQKMKEFFRLLHDYQDRNPDFAVMEKALKDPEVIAKIKAEIKTVSKLKEKSTIAVKIGDRCVPADPRTLSVWAEIYLNYNKNSESGICQVTGRKTVPLDKTISIMGLSDIGGQSSGCKMYSFNFSAATAYDWGKEGKDPNQCCIAPDVSASIAAALNELVAKSPSYGGKYKVLTWFDHERPKEENVLMLEAFGPACFRKKLEEGAKPEDIEENNRVAEIQMNEALDNILSGRSPACEENLVYHVLVIGANSSRLVFREHYKTTVANMAKYIKLWEEDKALVSSYKNQPTKRYSLNYMLRALVKPNMTPPDTQNAIQKELSGFLFSIMESMSKGYLLPDIVEKKAQSHIESKVFSDDCRVPELALQWLKIACARRERYEGEVYTMPTLNEKHPSQAYHYGRLFAVYAMIKYRSSKYKINNNKPIENFLSSHLSRTMDSPADCFPELAIQNSRDLASIKCTAVREGLHNACLSIYQYMTDPFPVQLSTEERSYFLLGYHHEMCVLNQEYRYKKTTKAGEEPEELSEEELTAED